STISREYALTDVLTCCSKIIDPSRYVIVPASQKRSEQPETHPLHPRSSGPKVIFRAPSEAEGGVAVAHVAYLLGNANGFRSIGGGTQYNVILREIEGHESRDHKRR